MKPFRSSRVRQASAYIELELSMERSGVDSLTLLKKAHAVDPSIDLLAILEALREMQALGVIEEVGRAMPRVWKLTRLNV